MDIFMGILSAAFVIFVAIMALRQGKENRGKSYEQRRDELYEYSQKRVEEYRQSNKVEGGSSEEE